jgi:RNA polymerase sigma factor (sigma-70 family)
VNDIPPRSEPVLVSEAIERSDEDRAGAFTRLLDRGLDTHYRIAAVILGDRVEAEDAVHDAAIVAWRGFAGLRDRDRFEAWFGRILVNGCRDRLRRRRRRPIVAWIPMLGDLDVGAQVRDDSHALANRDELERAFARLEPDHVVVIALRFFADLPIGEIARRLGIPEGTVKSRLHNGLKHLKAAVEANQETTP